MWRGASDASLGSVDLAPGIQVRHSKLCPTRDDGSCKCKPSYHANVWSAREGKRIFRTFPTLAAAKAWRADTGVALRRGTVRAGSSPPLWAAAEAWLDGVHSGAIRNRSGHRYKPSAIRGYEAALVGRVLPALGAERLADIRRIDLQDFADRLCADGLDASTVRNTLMPLRAAERIPSSYERSIRYLPNAPTGPSRMRRS
jgi:integrase